MRGALLCLLVTGRATYVERALCGGVPSQCRALRLLGLNGDGPPCLWPGVLCDEDQRVVSVSVRGTERNRCVPLPEGVFGMLPELEYLALVNASLCGAIPDDVGELNKLKELHIAENGLSGGLPRSLGRLTSLKVIHVDGNALDGSLEEALAALPDGVERLGLSRNRFTGPIPASLERFLHLRVLRLGGNRLQGPLPPTFAPNLEVLSVWGNNLTGNPAASSTDLFHVDLSGNQFSGPLNVGDVLFQQRRNDESSSTALAPAYRASSNALQLDLTGLTSGLETSLEAVALFGNTILAASSSDDDDKNITTRDPRTVALVEELVLSQLAYLEHNVSADNKEKKSKHRKPLSRRKDTTDEAKRKKDLDKLEALRRKRRSLSQSISLDERLGLVNRTSVPAEDRQPTKPQSEKKPLSSERPRRERPTKEPRRSVPRSRERPPEPNNVRSQGKNDKRTEDDDAERRIDDLTSQMLRRFDEAKRRVHHRKSS